MRLLAVPQTDTKVSSTFALECRIILPSDHSESTGTKIEFSRIFDALPRRHTFIFYPSIVAGSD
jgi:hypothetical protein